MSDIIGCSNVGISDPSLYEILKNCANIQSYETLPIEDYNDVCASNLWNYNKMISTNMYSTSSNISTSSFASDDSFGDNILEEDGRISLAYENLNTIPRRIAEKFAEQTRFLDLSYNNFQNLAFLSFFEELHTLILDRNKNLLVNTLPYLPNLKILWINNCDITNVTDWIHRIKMQCPALEHLSIMGNPGIQTLSNYCLPVIPHSPVNLTPMATYTVTDYREYILHVLPNLQYLDGVARDVYFTKPTKPEHTNGKVPSSSSVSSGHSGSDHKPATDNHRNSPTLSFKDFFGLRRRKNSYQSSSTN